MSNIYTDAEMENAVAIAMEMALCIEELDPQAHERLIDHTNGITGMYAQIAGWAREFEQWWTSLDVEDPRRDDWPIEIDEFARDKFNTLQLEAERSFRRA